MQKKKLLDFSITSISGPGKAYREEYIFITHEFGILYNMAQYTQRLFLNQTVKIMDSFQFSLNQPYRLKEGRIILIIDGQVTIRYNLIEYVITPSHIAVAPAGSIVQIMHVLPGTRMKMTGFGPNFIPFTRKEDHIEYHWGQQQDLAIPLTSEELKQAENYFLLLWETVQPEEFHREVVQYLLLAFLHFINHIRKGYQIILNNKLTHQEDIFNRFISLVDKHSISQRNVAFYADSLCLTPRYLNTVIRQVSGQTVMEWINQSIILEAKVLLKHNNLLVYQVSDKLNFSNPSFFCKFFKRMTGITPQEYQRE